MSLTVLTVFPSPVLGGAERLVLDQMRCHDPASYRHLAVALRTEHLDPEYQVFPGYQCLNSQTQISPRALTRLHRFVRAQQVNILHTHLQEADFYGYWLQRWNPSLIWVSTRHNTNHFRTRLFWRRLNGAISRRTSRVVAVSTAVKDFVSRYERVPRDRITVIHNGIDPARFAGTALRAVTRHSLGLDDSRFVVGIAGRISRQKGHRYLFEAVARRSLAGRLGIADRITFAGFRHDMDAMYRAMDALCMPSIYEGFGLAAVEAMLCGRLVVGSRVDGIREIIDDGLTGLLAAPANSEALAEVLLRIARREVDPAIAERGRLKALAEFDITANLSRLDALYRELASDAGLTV